ncbi:hypothetical protein AVEN_220792-1 [Araneus ventricosus]|uniref:Uncharacterized protein n=1 Tax=Araneus ventricosus TaxID=182803 RepID=A0A4Y2PZ04_ARAVE|nr:hypothetical protein AVEN_220792-1 [Araneus ventricosus]
MKSDLNQNAELLLWQSLEPLTFAIAFHLSPCHETTGGEALGVYSGTPGWVGFLAFWELATETCLHARCKEDAVVMRAHYWYTQLYECLLSVPAEQQHSIANSLQ